MYAVALHDTGRAHKAITVLEGALRQRPGNQEILAALASYLGRTATRSARFDAKQLVSPGPPTPTPPRESWSDAPPAGQRLARRRPFPAGPRCARVVA